MKCQCPRCDSEWCVCEGPTIGEGIPNLLYHIKDRPAGNGNPLDQPIETEQATKDEAKDEQTA